MARPNTFVTLMATALDNELQNRGIFSIGHAECEEIMTRIIERSSEEARRIERLEGHGG